MNGPEKRVLVGMSGGIDSTATCLMLREQGYEIVGLTMWVWGDEPVEARRLAESMGIEHDALPIWPTSARASAAPSYNISSTNTARDARPTPV